MSEKTPYIVLTAVFIVGFVGFIMMYTTANTGMFDVYGRAIAMESVGQAHFDKVQDSRNVYGEFQTGSSGVTQAQQIERTGIAVGQAYMTAEGQATGNTAGIVNTGKMNPSTGFEKQYVKTKEGCYVSILGRNDLTGKIGTFRPRWETNPEKTARKSEECYVPGQEVTLPDGEMTFANVMPAVMPQTRTDFAMYPWGAAETACCIPMQMRSTY